MKFLNLNALQTYVSAALYAIPALFISQGCTQSAAGVLDCSASNLPFLTPTVTFCTTALLAVLKFFVIPLAQPGGMSRNLFSQKAPISDSGATGTVSPADVRP